jgi:hypothetical protein
MSRSSRKGPHAPQWPPSAPLEDYYRAVRADLAMIWVWAIAPLKWLFEAAIRDGIPPPVTFQGLPPGQFPPIDAIKDELFGAGPVRGGAQPFRRNVAPRVRIPSRSDDRRAS